MTALLLSERAPAKARVLVLGAGGGLELKALAEAHPGWMFLGVDPATEMLRQAERALGDLMPRVDLQVGYIDDAHEGPFDAATCLLTLHFLEAGERRRTLREIHRRLRPGAPLVTAHGSFPQDEPARARWLSRYAAYAVASGADPADAEKAREAVSRSVQLLDPGQDATVLRDAGFHGVEMFFAALTWRGWVSYA